MIDVRLEENLFLNYFIVVCFFYMYSEVEFVDDIIVV